MFKITTTLRPLPRVLVEGNLAGRCVEELRSVCAPLRATRRPWGLDVSGVGFADPRGTALLGELAEAGAELVGGSAFLRELLREGRADGEDAGARIRAGELRREQELLVALRSGDEAAREELAARFAPELLASARRLLASEDEACLAVRDAFWAAFRGAEAPEGAGIATWLHGLVLREALHLLARRQAGADESLPSLLPRFTAQGRRVHDEADGFVGQEPPGAHLESLTPELEATVRACVERLPDVHRAVLLLCDVEGFGIREAASLLGLGVAEARMRLHRSRQALRLLLGRSLAGEPSAEPAGQPQCA